MNKRRICVITTSRADYGLLFWLMREINADKSLTLQLIVSGMHLEEKFGYTYKHIEKDGFRIDNKIALLMNDDSVKGQALSIGMGFSQFIDAYAKLNPDIIVVLGDRYELIPAVVSAVLAKIPIAHIHGGEITQGAIDELLRHAITKLSTLHFASTETYRKRIIQMGEHPKRVFPCGAPGIDNIYKLRLLSEEELKNQVPFCFKRPYALITYHPATLEKRNAKAQIREVLAALQASKINGLFTMANADAGGDDINRLIKQFCGKNPQRFTLINNMGQTGYLSFMKHCDLVLGNSSSGIIEASSFKVPVVDIGTRQKGRIRAKNVLHADCFSLAIKKSISIALAEKFKKKLINLKSPYDLYGDGKVAIRIKNRIKSALRKGIIINKNFQDIIF